MGGCLSRSILCSAIALVRVIFPKAALPLLIYDRKYCCRKLGEKKGDHLYKRLAKRRSTLILTGPAVKTSFNRSLMVNWWSIEVVDWVN